MDLDQLRTFLEVQRTRHFGRASRSLFITQSALSMRIKQLEQGLGATLFSRKRNDIQLTAAGKRFLPAAEELVRLWEEARRGVALAQRETPLLVVGGMVGVWDGWLPEQLAGMAAGEPALRWEARAGEGEELLRGVRERRLDVAFLFDPPPGRDLHWRAMAALELALMASQPGLHAGEACGGEAYVLVEWGRSFLGEHARIHPGAAPRLRTGSGRQARDWLERVGGAAYLERQRAGGLFEVADGFAGRAEVYAVYPEGGEREGLVEEVLARMAR
ncbi:MAG: LysR family transcriptional regulator [Magnetococcales bacterium]|nr:LysR family transcriptional regulator [Magnetococcales bacterium]